MNSYKWIRWFLKGQIIIRFAKIDNAVLQSNKPDRLSLVPSFHYTSSKTVSNLFTPNLLSAMTWYRPKVWRQHKLCKKLCKTWTHFNFQEISEIRCLLQPDVRTNLWKHIMSLSGHCILHPLLRSPDLMLDSSVWLLICPSGWSANFPLNPLCCVKS